MTNLPSQSPLILYQVIFEQGGLSRKKKLLGTKYAGVGDLRSTLN